jgi:acetoin utilization protein AcuA
MGETQTREIQTKRGPVELRTYVTADEVARLELDEGIGVFASYRSILSCLDSLIHQASLPGANLCLALHGGKHIVGYAVRRPPAAGERWAAMDPPILYEVFGENARGWRSQGLMKPMLEMVVNEPENEARILYIVGYSWTWDLDETKKHVHAYRDTIIHLLTPLGFKQYPTNEPNVSLRAENLFMARIGSEIERPVKRRFTNLLFGIGED